MNELKINPAEAPRKKEQTMEESLSIAISEMKEKFPNIDFIVTLNRGSNAAELRLSSLADEPAWSPEFRQELALELSKRISRAGLELSRLISQNNTGFNMVINKRNISNANGEKMINWRRWMQSPEEISDRTQKLLDNAASLLIASNPTIEISGEDDWAKFQNFVNHARAAHIINEADEKIIDGERRKGWY